jgi:hypothetical protein
MQISRTFSTSSVCFYVAMVMTTALCAGGASAQVGAKPDANPPQLVLSGQKDKDNRELHTWDRPGAFGKVTGQQKVLGDMACMIARIDLEAIGYHPKAKDASGAEMPGGGYFCAQKSHGDQPAATAPRLVMVNGILGWDRPSAFGLVPKALKSNGQQVCARAGSNLEAIAYHPTARDLQNNLIEGGGFFCAPKGQRMVAQK